MLRSLHDLTGKSSPGLGPQQRRCDMHENEAKMRDRFDDFDPEFYF